MHYINHDLKQLICQGVAAESKSLRLQEGRLALYASLREGVF